MSGTGKNFPAKGNGTWGLLSAALAVLSLAAFVLLTKVAGLDAVVGALIAFFLFLLLLPAALWIEARCMRPSGAENDAVPSSGKLLADSVQTIHLPTVISDLSGRILWVNDAFLDMTGEKRIRGGENLFDFIPAGPEQLFAKEGGEILTVRSRQFVPHSYPVPYDNREYRITLFEDRTELMERLHALESEEAIVVYAVIDNLDELMQSVQEKYRAASGKIEEILRNWAESCGGMMKEYERDRYVFIISRKCLEEEKERKFAILDEIRNVKSGDGILPVTVSMGAADVAGTYAEKEDAAQAALDLALQRGGDQVVLKYRDGIEYYGGKNKSVQKKVKVRARVIANELISLIGESGQVFLMGHRYPDFDSIGSCIGLAMLADFCGVDFYIVADTDDANVRLCMGKLAENGKYLNRFIKADAALDLIHTDALLVISDVNNFGHLESPQLASVASRVVVIDHHRKTTEFEREPVLSYIEPSASSCCELVSEILELTVPSGTMLKDEADLLLSGIILDTKQFSRNVGARTFSAAQYLRSESATPGDAQEMFRMSLDDFKREAVFENDITTYRGCIAIACSTGEGSPEDRVAAAKAADKLLSISGILASFALVKIGDVIHISARSTGKINVQLILEELKGGGHFDVAGAQLSGKTMVEAMSLLKTAIDRYLDN